MFVPVRTLVVLGRVWSCMRSAIWFVCGSGCLDELRVTYLSEGIVVILTEEAHPIIVFTSFGGTAAGVGDWFFWHQY